MSAFAETARELEQLADRLTAVEARLQALTEQRNQPSRTAYNVPEVAAMFGKHPKTIRRWIETGRLAAEDMGGWYAVPASAVDAVLPQVQARRSA